MFSSTILLAQKKTNDCPEFNGNHLFMISPKVFNNIQLEIISRAHMWNMVGVDKGSAELTGLWGSTRQKKTSCMITVEIQHVVKVHGWWEDWPTGIVLQRQSVWNVCGQWWRGHDASPRSIQEPTPVFVPCCTWRWPSHMPSRSHYSDCPLWQKLKVPANREMSKHREPTDSFVFLSDLLQCQRTTVITATKELERGL